VGPDAGAEYDARIEIDLADLGPLIAKPHNPGNVVPVEEVEGGRCRSYARSWSPAWTRSPILLAGSLLSYPGDDGSD
jgi:homoaconitase/3-isopropylmalate dehydratase large subunit